MIFPPNLCEKGLYHYGKPFIKNTVYKILKNERYVGIYRTKDEVLDNIYPQMIPSDIYEAVRKRIDKNRFGKRGVQAVYLLRHKVSCGYCGHSISAECGTSSSGEQIRYYKCSGRKKYRNGCKKTAVRKEILEDFVLNNIITQLTDEKTIDKIVNGIMQMQEKQARENSSLSALLREQKQTANTLNNLLSAIEQGIYSNTTNKRLHELEEKQHDLELKIAIEKSKSVVVLSKSEILKYYESALRLEPQLLIDFIVKEIVLYNDKIEFHYSNPTRTDTCDNTSFAFYNGTANLPCVVQNKAEPEMRKLEVKMTV